MGQPPVSEDVNSFTGIRGYKRVSLYSLKHCDVGENPAEVVSV